MNGDGSLAKQVRRHTPGVLGLSAIVMHELFFGASKSRNVEQNLARIDELRFPIIEFDDEDGREAGQIRALLAGRGTPIGPYDVLIAGQARTRNLVVVTHNTREFARVPGLRIEDWSV